MIGWIDDDVIVVAPSGGQPARWECADCGAGGAAPAGQLPAGWVPWITPELGCSEDVLCCGCALQRAVRCDLERTGDGLPAGEHPWAVPC